MMSFLTESRSDNEIIEPRVSFDNIPLSAIRKKTRLKSFRLFSHLLLTHFFPKYREKLSDCLSPEKVLYSEDGYARDWRGLFSFSGLSQSDYTLISQAPDKTSKLLDLWLRRNKDNNNEVTLSQLLHSLSLIDRYDVYDDVYQLLSEYYDKRVLHEVDNWEKQNIRKEGQALK